MATRDDPVALGPGEEQALIALYDAGTRSLDRLPYTDEFDDLHVKFCVALGRTLTRAQVWHALTNLRKKNALPRKRR